MKNTSVAIVLTTINGGEIIKNLTSNLLKHGHQDRVKIYAIPDLPTPKEFYTTCKTEADKGCGIFYPTMEEQEVFLKTLPDCPPIPERTDNRRNVGFLMAVRDKADVLLSLDDDNFYDADTDFITDHVKNLEKSNTALPVVESSNGFFNCCKPLHTKVSCEVYPRGYPLRPRHQPVEVSEQKNQNLPTWINAGLWIESPDIDAFEWLSFGQAARSDGWTESNYRLALSTWCPVNSQNTTLLQELIPAYYFLPMRSQFLELPIDRHGDILSGYFALKVAKVHGATVNFGSPIARHIRNQHDYAKDCSREMLFLSVLDEFLEWLMAVNLQKGTVSETYSHLAQELESQSDKFKGATWTPGMRRHFQFMAECMRKWVRTVDMLGA